MRTENPRVWFRPLSPLRFRKMPEPLFRRYVFVAPSEWIRFYDVASFDLRRVPNSDIIRTDQKKAKGFERLYRHTILVVVHRPRCSDRPKFVFCASQVAQTLAPSRFDS